MLQCVQTTQKFLMKSVDGEASSPLVLSNLPSAFTPIHLHFFFFYLENAYVCPSVRALHSPNVGSREEWDGSCLRSL